MELVTEYTVHQEGLNCILNHVKIYSSMDPIHKEPTSFAYRLYMSKKTLSLIISGIIVLVVAIYAGSEAAFKLIEWMGSLF